MIITIDGPVATGKSSVAKKVAESLGFIFFDTGAMYRAVAYGIIKHRINSKDPSQLQEFLKNFDFDIKVIRREKHYFFEEEDITQAIRQGEVNSLVSEISALKEVRDTLVALQRKFAEGVNAVFEGRDMGTVVFPDAALKIFLIGRDDIRARRRFEELQANYPEETKNLTFEKCLAELRERDHYDSTRQHSPLTQAKDAFVIDTSNLSLEEVVFRILEYKDSLKTKRPK